MEVGELISLIEPLQHIHATFTLFKYTALITILEPQKVESRKVVYSQHLKLMQAAVLIFKYSEAH